VTAFIVTFGAAPGRLLSCGRERTEVKIMSLKGIGIASISLEEEELRSLLIDPRGPSREELIRQIRARLAESVEDILVNPHSDPAQCEVAFVLGR